MSKMRVDLVRIFFFFFTLDWSRLSSATILLKSSSVSFPDLPAKFALEINSSGICGALFLADPLDACRPLSNRVSPKKTGDGVNFVLIVRGECAFTEKIQNAQNAGFRAAIVHDNQDKGNLVYMMINRENASVSAVFVSKEAGEYLKEHGEGKEGECCIFPFDSGTAWTVLAISFISFLVICSILVIAIFTPRHWLNSRGRNTANKNIDAKMVEALPCFTFGAASHSNESQGGETCAICLEDYKDEEVLKVLPCRHEFHSTCVDSWLTKWGTFCPVCKHDMRTKSRCFEVKRRIWL